MGLSVGDAHGQDCAGGRAAQRERNRPGRVGAAQRRGAGAQVRRTLVGAPKGSLPSPRKVCQKATEKRSHSPIVLPAMTSLLL